MVNSIAQPGTLLAHDGITCKNTDGAGEKGAQHAQHNTIIKSVIDATVLQHAGLAISNIGSTLAYPKDGAEIAPAVVVANRPTPKTNPNQIIVNYDAMEKNHPSFNQGYIDQPENMGGTLREKP